LNPEKKARRVEVKRAIESWQVNACEKGLAVVLGEFLMKEKW
jgi:hypothetical protein